MFEETSDGILQIEHRVIQSCQQVGCQEASDGGLKSPVSSSKVIVETEPMADSTRKSIKKLVRGEAYMVMQCNA